MILGKIIGHVVSTIKNHDLDKYKLLIVQPEFNTSDNLNFVAIDLAGAGVGDSVLVLRGSQVNNAVSKKIPTDAAVIGIVESVFVNKI